MMRRLCSSCGSASTEAVASIVFVMAAFIGGLTATYVGYVRVWLDRSLYESLICLASIETKHAVPIRVCENEFRMRVLQALPIGTIQATHFSRLRKSVVAEVRFLVNERAVLSLSQTLPLPLRLSTTFHKRISTD